ncbi:carbohydrate kinase [Rothia sp. ZJ932]|uniref:carbohydrate kinase family protein n=1 Tax=Rothia sp. ZJ932 TaxID=2810516 RepID=UPI001968710D|nr:carbohydrate kinase [Rothia sp. ZJ932]QRZ61692.1 carbohydrate kinase [Rothia sp. ZJ932]
MLTVIGEALVDIVKRPGEPEHAHPGGSPMNVAVGVSRLGHHAQFIGRYGADDNGEMIDKHLKDSGVILPVGADQKKTSTAQANISETGAADYEFDIDWSLDAAADALAEVARAASAIHVGSIGAMLEPGASTVVETIKAADNHALITYDPNCRPTIIPDSSVARAWVDRVVAHADVIKASDEDILWLYPHRTLEESAVAWLEAGVNLVVVTRGEMGPWAVNSQTRDVGVAVPAHRVEVADTVGAGDSLMAALIANLLDRGIEGAEASAKLDALTAEDLTEILTFSATAAGITVSRAGANPPTRSELMQVLGN